MTEIRSTACPRCGAQAILATSEDNGSLMRVEPVPAADGYVLVTVGAGRSSTPVARFLDGREIADRARRYPDGPGLHHPHTCTEETR